jgi:hypothetical protein
MTDCRQLLWGVVASALTVTLATLPSGAQAESRTSESRTSEPRAVIELFTSQGCSSCPAADKLLGELSKDPSLVAISVAVDYWDYLGWQDTLAIPGHTKRQKAYAHVRGDRELYTPQVIVNGSVQALGNDRGAIERAILASRYNNTTALSLPLTLSVDNDKLTVSAPAGKSDTSAEVWLCPLSKAVQVAIGRGENSGKTVTYHNVVRRWVKLGVWTGKAESWSIPVSDIKTDGIDAVAVVVQGGKASAPGAMLGAALASLN